MSNSKVKVNEKLSILHSNNKNENSNIGNRRMLQKLLHNRFQVKLGHHLFNAFRNIIESEISKIVSSPQIKSESINKLYHSINNEIQKSVLKGKSVMLDSTFTKIDDKIINNLEGNSVENNTSKINESIPNKVNKVSLIENNQELDGSSIFKKASYNPFRKCHWNRLIEYNTYLDKLDKLHQKEITRQKRKDISESLQIQLNEKLAQKSKELNEDQIYDSEFENRLKYFKDLEYLNKIKKQAKYVKSKEERDKEYKEFLLKKNRIKQESKDKEKKEVDQIIKLFEEENLKKFEKKRRTKEILIKYRKENDENIHIKKQKCEQEKSRDIKELEMNLKCMAEQKQEEEKLQHEKMKKFKKYLDFSSTLSNTNSNFFKHKFFSNPTNIENGGFKYRFANARNYKENMIQNKFNKKNQSTELDELLLEQQLEKENLESKHEEAKKRQKRKNEEENIKHLEVQIQAKKQEQLKEKKSDEGFMQKIKEDYNCFLKEEKSKIESYKKKSKSYYDEVKRQIEEKKSKIIPEMTETEYFINKKLLESAERSLNKIEKSEISPSSTFYK